MNDDGSIVPPIDPELMRRLETAKDDNGVIHDPELANEYFEALQRQGDEVRRRAGWPEPVIERGAVFPTVDGEPLPQPSEAAPDEVVARELEPRNE